MMELSKKMHIKLTVKMKTMMMMILKNELVNIKFANRLFLCDKYVF